MNSEESSNQEPSTVDQSLDHAITRFMAAEEALRNFYEVANELRNAQDSLDTSRAALQSVYENSIEHLGKAENSIRDGATSLRDLSDELKGTARELVEASTLIRKFEPERLYTEVGEFKTLHKELENQIRKWTRSCLILFLAVVALVVSIFVVL